MCNKPLRVTNPHYIKLADQLGVEIPQFSNQPDYKLQVPCGKCVQRIPTGKLNAFLGKIQAAHPHPLRGGKQPRILFATQASTRPPRFVIFATGFLEHGYRRYIERSLREEFGFEGTPIQISVNIREKKKRK